MCGIACFVGKNAGITCFEMLKKLEYRGYDSAGMVGLFGDDFKLFKKEGGVDNIKKFAQGLDSSLVISHTRWATHGDTTEKNAHPHISFDGSLALVHNGIIENFLPLKNELEKRGIKLKGETDSEVAVNIFALEKGDLLEKGLRAREKLVGSYAFAILSREEKKILFMRKKSPLYLAKTKDGIMASSDIVCFFKVASNYYSLGEDEIAIASESGIEIYNSRGERQSVTMTELDSTFEEISLCGHPHFMEKEISEIPAIIKRLEAEYKGGRALEKVRYLFSNVDNIFLVGCGTAFHACMFGAKVLEEKLRIPCHAYVASELKYSSPIIKRSLGIFVSQSGETADTLGCLELFKKKNAKTLAITNVSHSTLSRMADEYLSVFAGPEIAVASTKAYVAQILTLMLLASFLGGETNGLLSGFAEKSKEVLKIDEKLVDYVSRQPRVFFIGRGLGSITSLEAALKLKEISYKSAEGYPAGELKHGTIALIESGTPVVVFLTGDPHDEKTIANLEEVRSRGAKIVLVSPRKYEGVHHDFFIKLPDCSSPWLTSVLAIIPFQLLAYRVSLALGNNPDRPRNLAKSVTVE